MAHQVIDLSRRVLAVALLATGLVVLGATPATAAEPDVIHSLTNEARWSNGQAGLIRSAELDAVAQGWAEQLAASGTLSHNPNTGAQIPGGWSSWGENVAQGYPDGASVHAGWMNSDGHRANILGDFTDMGIAFIAAGGTTWGVEVFATYAGHVGPAPPVAAAPADPAPPVEATPAAATPAPTPTAAPTPTPTAARAPIPTFSAGPVRADGGADATPLVITAIGVAVAAAVALAVWRVLAARASRRRARH